MYMYHSGEAIFKIWSFLPHNYFFLFLGNLCRCHGSSAVLAIYFSSSGKTSFPGCLFIQWTGKWRIYLSMGKSWSHVNKPGGWSNYLITLCLCNQPAHPAPEYKTRYPCKCITICLAGPSPGYLLLSVIFVCFVRPPCPLPYQNVLYLHLSRPRDRISICLSKPATCPHDHPEMRGGDDSCGLDLR